MINSSKSTGSVCLWVTFLLGGCIEYFAQPPNLGDFGEATDDGPEVDFEGGSELDIGVRDQGGGIDFDQAVERDQQVDFLLDQASGRDQIVSADLAPLPDLHLDMAPDIAQAMDAAMDASTVIEPGSDCVDSAECVGEYEQCVDDACRIEFRPDVFRVSTIRVIEPYVSAGLLEGFLTDALNGNQLNLLVESGGYTDLNEFLWYIGNGRYYRADDQYEYIPNTPVQNFFGFWRDAGEGLFWASDDEVVFKMRLPTGTVEDPEGGPDVSCFTHLAMTVEVTVTPRTNEEGDLYMNVQLNGVLTFADADLVEFLFNGQAFRLTQLLAEDDLNIDQDGDGEPDAYPFHYDMDAPHIVFSGVPPLPDGSNRDPDLDVVTNACEW